MTYPRKTAIEPDHTYVNELRAKGYGVQLMWDLPAPSYTGIAWLSCYMVTDPEGWSKVAIVETYDNGGILVCLEERNGPDGK